MARLRSGSFITLILMLLLGLLLLINPWQVQSLLINICGILLILAGGIGIISSVLQKVFTLASTSTLVGCIGAVIAGIIFLIRPGMISNLLHFFFGAIIVAHGIVNLLRAIDRKSSDPNWFVPLILSILAIIAGVFVFTGAATRFALQVIGIVLIYNSLVGLWLILKN